MNYNTPLPPFKWFILENFPYIEDDFDALTNWQLFCKLGKEMNKIIEKTNLTGEQVEILTNAFNELKAYIDNYFENLDVQEEINNKLDEMAEQGVLTDIIAQYLQLAGVLAYDTVNDMKVAENLAEGSICKTLGYSNIQDKNGSFYKVREILNTDVIDNINIIALANENLVAEKIQEKQPMISYKPYYLNSDYYFTVSYSPSKMEPSLFVSPDSINWERVYEIPKIAFMEDCDRAYDFSCTIDNGYFYMAYDYINEDFNGWNDLDPDLFRGGNKVGVARTKDFINWEKWNLDIDLQYKQTFAPEFFIDNDNTHYISISLSTTEIIVEDGTSRYFKKNYILRTDNEFKNIISTTNNLDVQFVNIDPFIYKEGSTYYLMVSRTSEGGQYINLYSSSNIMSFSTLVSEIKMINKEGNLQGIEAPSLIKIGTRYVLFADVYSLEHSSVMFVSEDLEHWSNWNLLPVPETMFHFTPVKANSTIRAVLDEGYKVLNYPQINFENNNNGMLNEYKTGSSADYPYTLFVPLPNATYVFYGTASHTIEPINMFFSGSKKSKEFSVVNGSGTGEAIKVVLSNQTVQVAPKNSQVLGGIWNNSALNVHGANLTPIDITITAKQDTTTINYQACKRIGNIVNLIVSFTSSVNVPAYTEMFENVPASFDTCLFPICERNTQSPTLASVDKWGYVSSYGLIQNQRELTANQNYRFSVTYFCK